MSRVRSFHTWSRTACRTLARTEDLRQVSISGVQTLPWPTQQFYFFSGSKLKSEIATCVFHRPSLLESGCFPFNFETKALPLDPEIQADERMIAEDKLLKAKIHIGTSDANSGAHGNDLRPLLLIEDSSIRLPELGGGPGPYAKHFPWSWVQHQPAGKRRTVVHSTVTLANCNTGRTESITAHLAGELVPQPELENPNFGDMFLPDDWKSLGAEAGSYDSLDAREKFGCHISRAMEKVVLALTLRRHAEAHLESHGQFESFSDFREFVCQHVHKVLGKSVGVGVFSNFVCPLTVDWLADDVVYRSGVRLTRHGRARVSVLKYEALMQLPIRRQALLD
mmetsp:Transcript_133840/g.338151  ORF Transcript_133840/g.338151 Transcript_133840/m.338151 type:complete len:337 (-) Transcript_133840:23-1033(-)